MVLPLIFGGILGVGTALWLREGHQEVQSEAKLEKEFEAELSKYYDILDGIIIDYFVELEIKKSPDANWEQAIESKILHLISSKWLEIYRENNFFRRRITKAVKLMTKAVISKWLEPRMKRLADRVCEKLETTSYNNAHLIKTFKSSGVVDQANSHFLHAIELTSSKNFIDTINKIAKETEDIDDYWTDSHEWDPWIKEIFKNQLAIKIKDLYEHDSEYIASLTGEEYEAYCKKCLEDSQWTVSNTPKSGDQGVDLLAYKEGIKVCIQCKRHSKPVGNKAVQEVNAGKCFYKGTHAVVVSNSGFTKAAEILAESADVILIGDTDLERLETILSLS